MITALCFIGMFAIAIIAVANLIIADIKMNKGDPDDETAIGR